jgi:hypothetical protein
MSFPVDIPALPIYRGDTFSQTFVIKVAGEIRDLVADGWTDWVSSWRPYPDADEVIVLSVDDSLANVSSLIISASSADTRLMGRAGVWDLQASRGAEIRTWLRGEFSPYEKDVTDV